MTTPYTVPYQSLGGAEGASPTEKERRLEQCMVANGWKKTNTNAVALTEPVYARIGSKKITHKGIATGYLDRTGTMKMKTESGEECVGSLRYLTNWTGDGSFRCDDGDSAKIKFQGISGFSGYGGGVTKRGLVFKFVYGVEPEDIQPYLK